MGRRTCLSLILALMLDRVGSLREKYSCLKFEERSLGVEEGETHGRERAPGNMLHFLAKISIFFYLYLTIHFPLTFHHINYP